MARLLLSSGQVQVVASCIVVVMCAATLFVSGYIIQQRTLNELRIAIRPRPSKTAPRTYLPDKFKPKAIELQDGSIMLTESDDQREREARIRQMIIEVQQSQRVLDAFPEPQVPRERKPVDPKKVALVEKLKAQMEEKMENPLPEDESEKHQKPETRAQRRRKIKQELQQLSRSDAPAYYQRRLW